MSEEYEQHDTPFGRLIREAKEEAFHARRQLRRELPDVSTQTKREVAESIADYHDVLQDYSDERSLRIAWEDRLPANPDDLLVETAEVQVGVSARNRDAVQTQQAPAAAVLSPRELLALGKELDAIAKELGFAAEAKTSREQFHIASPDDDHPEPVNDNVPKPGEQPE